MDYLAELDGDMSISDTESTCEEEQRRGFQLDSIQYGTLMKDGKVFLVNKASFNEKLFGRLKNLSFAEVEDGKDPAVIREKAEAEGWTFLCDSRIYVKGQTKRVIVCGKKTF